MKKLIITIISGLIFATALSAKETPVFKDGERVLFLGDSITRAGGWHSRIALFYETRYPNRRVNWLNAGISGDTSAGAVKRLQWDVFERKPNSVVIMLGMNDAARGDLPKELGMGEIGSDKRVAEYAKNMRNLVEKLQAAKVGIILCTPSPYDSTVKLKTPGNPAANEALTKMASFCRELAKEFDLPLVDFNGPMNAINTAYQKTKPTFTLIGGDRVHPGALGCTVMAHLFLKAQGASGLISEVMIDAAENKVTKEENAKVADLKVKDGAVSFSLTEKALPMPFEGDSRQALKLSPENELLKAMAKLERPADAHTRMGATLGAAKNGVGLEFDPANSTAWDDIYWRDHLHRQLFSVRGLPEGEYELRIDDKLIGRWFNDDLAMRINLSGLRTTPQYQQVKKVSEFHDKRHKTASYAPRMIAYTRHFALDPFNIDTSNADAVKIYLEKLIADPTAKDRVELGGYTQSMAKQYLKHKPKEEKTVNEIASVDDEIYRLNTPTIHRYELRPVTHPISSEARQKTFDQRRTPEQLAKLAKDFCKLLVLDNAGLLRTNLRRRPGLQKVAKLAKGGKPVEALNSYRDYLFDKLRNAAAYGLPGELLDPYKKLIKLKNKDKVVARAQELLAGRILPDTAPMQPGSVWLPRPKEAGTGASNPWTPKTFQPLAEAYLMTGEARYLQKWIDYLDGWAMFEDTDDHIRGTDISDSDSHSISQVLAIYKILGGIARMQPAAQTEFPADSLARILSKCIRVYLPLSIVYHDSNPQNWTPGNTAYQMKVAALMDEFRAAETIFNRARHRHENYGTIQNLPDGGETEHALWYNAHYFHGAIEPIKLVDSRRHATAINKAFWEAPILSADWKFMQRDKIIQRARYFLQMLSPQSKYPIGNRSDNRTLPDWMSAALVEYALLNGAPDLQVLLNTFRGNTASGLPDFTMSGFPYSGSWIMRKGWGKEDGYAHFFSSPYPVGGHAMRGMKSNNGFWLSEAGQDLLVSGSFGAYSNDRSPLRVDGREQFALAGIGNPGINKNHKGFSVAYIDPQPADWRSHSSVNFDFAEGVYSGPYGDSIDDHHDNKDYRSGFLAERAREVITGVTHQRQVFHVKNPDLWIVVDRLKSQGPHEYTLDWYLPAPLTQKSKNRYKPKTFAASNIFIDDALQTVTTSAADMPNLRIRHFGPKLNLSRNLVNGEAVKNDYTYKYRMYDLWRLSGTWQSSGNDVIISLIEALPKGGTTKIKNAQNTESGFEATLAEGQRLQFNATEANVTLTIDGRMLVLGEESFEAQGKQRTPVYRPIAPVRIDPVRNVIAGATPVTLACPTSGVDIRYTLDGSEPTIHSPLYTAPFTIDNSVTVKARAFRKGLTATPTNLAGTHATGTRVAHYKLVKALDPVAPLNDKRYKTGLKADYYEGDWKDLAFFPERVKPKRTFNARWLFDRCQPSTDKTFGWTYSGYISIPEDGIYTFYAPEEMLTSPQEPGYNLRLFVGQELLWNNRPSGQLNEWYPATTRHAYGTWSIALKKGLHPVKVSYVDYRQDAVERLNHPGLRLNTIWVGSLPKLKVSGPGLELQPIPNNWCFKN
ncbi:lipolytic enzyme, G-D-S-L [Lentisphaera araneosa HTCC2155]|uniref:Lipolytic enzyme, G-D-S-L n=1 Tax=Lentisphaera araneosa HTCC2155 TaxID=313628 RepID=A6DPU7_9BACT|nr:SGNH/GDSL hydrolase family protein [Lentisphaera araneosa]EDM26392.1 lipolytic enzyme, G-D-S-L [Lentisphaera araneosa HTCC2155]